MHKKTTFFGRLATTAIHFLVQKTLVNTATFFGHIGDLANGDPLYKLRPRVQFLFSSPPFFLLALFIPKVFFGLTGKANLPFGLFFFCQMAVVCNFRQVSFLDMVLAFTLTISYCFR